MSHRPALVALALAAVTLPVAASAVPAEPPTVLVADLSGTAATAGDPDGSGRAEITIDIARLRMCYALTTTGIAAANGANLLRGAVSDKGKSVLRLVAPADGESRACLELTAYDANEIARKPENFFVSVRNSEYPAGALRGQLHK